jgi:wobble nucleotide-excising tRNase
MTSANSEFESVEGLSLHVKELFTNGLNAVLLYAFNTTGKTRLANTFEDYSSESETETIESIGYGALFEDIFSWDNDSYTLRFDVDYSWILKLIKSEGLENRIVDTFNQYSPSRVEPAFDFYKGSVSFRIAKGDDQGQDNIKISRGEESLLIWSIFRTLLDLVVETLEDVEEDRSTDVFNHLGYVIIDDPVSSIDDTKIIDIALDLVDITKRLVAKDVKVLIMTHHALFYNVIANSIPRRSQQRKKYGLYSLSKADDGLRLVGQDDSPFAYHLFTKTVIQDAINNDSVERYHFNLFRALLEKTANFLGYNSWGECLNEDSRNEFARLLNIYSHSRLSEIESKELSSNEKDIFKTAFDQFVQDYKWSR